VPSRRSRLERWAGFGGWTSLARSGEDRCFGKPIGRKMATTNFFISYTGADDAWAQWIAWQLEAAGYTTTLQAWDSRPGMNFLAWMNQAAKEAERTLVVLSPAYEQGEGFTVPEWTAALHKDPSGSKGLLVPVRVAEGAGTGLLGPLGWIDLVGLDEDRANAALLEGVRRERLKPAVAPASRARDPPSRPFREAPTPRHRQWQPGQRRGTCRWSATRRSPAAPSCSVACTRPSASPESDRRKWC
jgi:TIR domain